MKPAFHSKHVPLTSPKNASPGKQPLITLKDFLVKKRLPLPATFPDALFWARTQHCSLSGAQSNEDEDVLEKPRDHMMLHECCACFPDALTKSLPASAWLTPAGSVDTRACTTQVFFRELTEQEIHTYVATHEPMDKAGAYAIQGGAACFADHMDGEYSNVVGLPLPLVAEMLRANNLCDAGPGRSVILFLIHRLSGSAPAHADLSLRL